MANKYRNELEITLGGEKILLRPTFENIANLEGNLGFGVPTFAYRLHKISSKSEAPSMTEMAKVAYHCQADKKFSLEQIWDLCMIDGVAFSAEILKFVSQITVGDKAAPDVSDDSVKKN